MKKYITKPYRLPFYVRFLLRLQYWDNHEVKYGFYIMRSYFSWGEDLDRKGQGLRLKFALGNKDFLICYL